MTHSEEQSAKSKTWEILQDKWSNMFNKETITDSKKNKKERKLKRYLKQQMQCVTLVKSLILTQ